MLAHRSVGTVFLYMVFTCFTTLAVLIVIKVGANNHNARHK